MLKTLGFVIALLLLAPLGSLLGAFSEDTSDTWGHLLENVLGQASLNTIGLALSVGAMTLVLGTSLAWFVALYQFPGRKKFRWLLLMPLAFPPYVFSFIYLGFLNPDSMDSWASGMRFWLMDHRFLSLSLVLSFCFYPYVYIMALSAFETQGPRIIEVSQSLGHSIRQAFFKACFPASKPWIFAGLSLVLMEVCADFGAVSVFNVDTWTTAIYSSWYALFSLETAAQLSLCYLSGVFLLLWWEKRLKSQKNYQSTGRASNFRLIETSQIQQYLIVCFISIVFILSVLGPFSQLIFWSLKLSLQDIQNQYLTLALESFQLGVIVALAASALSLFIAAINRTDPSSKRVRFAQWAGMGYAIPGTVLAIAFLFTYKGLENILLDFLEQNFNFIPEVFITDSILLVIFGLTSRFLIMALQPIQASLLRITHSLHQSAESLGHSNFSIVQKIYIPLLRSGIFTALLMVFIETIKELPITLMTRPFGSDTLAVKVYEWTSEGQWEQSAFPALIIVVLSMIPVWFLSKSMLKENKQ